MPRGRAAAVAEGGHWEWTTPPAPAFAAGEDGYVSGRGWRFRADQAVRSAPVEADVDGDGLAEIVFATVDGVVRAVSVASR